VPSRQNLFFHYLCIEWRHGVVVHVNSPGKRTGSGYTTLSQQAARGQKRTRSGQCEPLQNFSPRRSSTGLEIRFILPVQPHRRILAPRTVASHRRALHCAAIFIILFSAETKSTPHRSRKQCESEASPVLPEWNDNRS
jgi:hypothetical protein